MGGWGGGGGGGEGGGAGEKGHLPSQWIQNLERGQGLI